MNKKDNSRSRESRERLKQALLSSLEHQDILDVTVSGLCQKAQVNRSTFYSHYDSVADLMEELELDIGKNLFDRFAGDNYDPKHPSSQHNLTVVLAHIQENQAFYRAYLSQSTAQIRLDWAFGQLLEQFVRPMLRSRSVSDQATEYYFAFFRAGLTAVITRWVKNRCQESPEEITTYLGNLLAHPEFSF